MLPILRWLAIVPGCVASWYLALVVGLLLHSQIDRFCPPDLMVSGFCTASWYPAIERIVICLGAALSAFLVVVTAAVVAPAHRVAVSRFVLATGAAVAIWMGVRTDAYLELAFALIAGLLAAWLIAGFARRASLSKG